MAGLAGIHCPGVIADLRSEIKTKIVMRSFTFSIFLVVCIFLNTSCNDRLQRMPIEKFAKTIYNIDLNLKQDSVIFEFRNFGEEENTGQNTLIVHAKGQKAKDFINTISWSKPKLQSLDPESTKQNEDYENSPVIFDVQNQYVQIWYSEMETKFIKLQRYLKDDKINDLYYYKEFIIDESGQSRKKFILYDKKNDVLFLIFNNM